MPWWAHTNGTKAFIQLEAFVVFTTCNKTRNKQVQANGFFLWAGRWAWKLPGLVLYPTELQARERKATCLGIPNESLTLK